jgi:hypothetical protein
VIGDETLGLTRISPKRRRRQGGASKSRSAKIAEAGRYCHRPDVIVSLITTQAPRPLAPTDCALIDWKQAGLHTPSFFRLFPVTLPQRESVQACFKAGFGA